jgi:hypothetical protein
MSWQAAQWALTEAPMLKSDPTGRLVLAYLGAKADKNGRNAFPQVLSIAHALDLNPEVVPRVLKRLSGYGLITKDGTGPQGQARWTLNVGTVRTEDSFEAFCERHRGKRSARQSRWRQGSDVDDLESPTVDDSKCVTVPDVDDDESSRRRLSVVSKTTDDRLVDDSKYPHKGPYKGPKGPDINPSAPSAQAAADAAESELDLGLPQPPPKPSTDTLDEQFARWWVAYPKKRKKKDAQRSFAKAAKAGHRPEFLIAEAERWAGVWAAAETTQQYIPDPTTWLNGERWTDEPPHGRLRAVSGGYQPYQNPTDQSVYDEPL